MLYQQEYPAPWRTQLFFRTGLLTVRLKHGQCIQLVFSVACHLDFQLLDRVAQYCWSRIIKQYEITYTRMQRKGG